MHYDSSDKLFRFIFFLSFSLLCSVFINWFIDIFDESYRYNHNKRVLQGLKYGIILFIISEIMFFFCFFLSFLYYSLAPSVFLGCLWPPLGIRTASITGIPLFNTILLLVSGYTLYISEMHLAQSYRYECTVVFKKYKQYWEQNNLRFSSSFGVLFRSHVIEGFAMTLVYASIFLLSQYYEYNIATFNITDSVYGSIFYLMTGFHGLHVIIGLIFIYICIENHGRYFYDSTYSNFSLICATWYWHFVDIIWIFLFILVYWWGG